jgi:hypothetical protein
VDEKIPAASPGSTERRRSPITVLVLEPDEDEMHLASRRLDPHVFGDARGDDGVGP